MQLSPLLGPYPAAMSTHIRQFIEDRLTANQDLFDEANVGFFASISSSPAAFRTEATGRLVSHTSGRTSCSATVGSRRSATSTGKLFGEEGDWPSTVT